MIGVKFKCSKMYQTKRSHDCSKRVHLFPSILVIKPTIINSLLLKSSVKYPAKTLSIIILNIKTKSKWYQTDKHTYSNPDKETNSKSSLFPVWNSSIHINSIFLEVAVFQITHPHHFQMVLLLILFPMNPQKRS